ncbi:MAG: efflux RND transporter permease subunit [Acidobacteriota bacterium]
MRIIDFSLRRRVTVAMVAVAVTLFGVVAFTRLPVHLLPELSYPSLTIETRYDGAAPAEIESLLTRPIEEAVGVVGGVQRMTSLSRPGLSQVTLEFGWGRAMDFAALDVRQKLDLVRLPDGADKPAVLRFDPSNDPILRLYLTSTDESTDPATTLNSGPDGALGDALFHLRYLADDVLKKDLEPVAGLAAVKVHGGYEEEIEVRVDEGKLSLLGLDLLEVRDRLGNENVSQAGGSLYEREARYLVRSRAELETPEEIAAVVLRSEGGRPVTLGDVATVGRGHAPREVITRHGGREAVELALFKEGDANTVQVAKAVHARLDALREELPAGVELAVGTDQSAFIRASIREVLGNAALGGLIAVAVLLLFLKNARSTAIVGLSIPLSVIATFFLMYRSGTSLNVMSLGGLALGVGMLVDNAIVVLEAIHARREAGASALDAAREGASEVGQAVVASTLTTVAVFLPVVFLDGVAAQLFRDQALTVSFSLVASLLVSLTLIPTMAALGGRREVDSAGDANDATAETTSRARRIARTVFVTAPAAPLRWLRHGMGLLWALATRFVRPIGRLFDSGLGALQTAYPPMLRAALRHRALVLAVAFLAVLGAAALVPRLGVDLVPTLSQGEFSFRVELDEGTPLEATDRYLDVARRALDGDARVAAWSTISGGAGLASGGQAASEGENVARVQVRMADDATPADETAVADALRAALLRGAGDSTSTPDESPSGDGAGARRGTVDLTFERPSVFTFRTPLEVELYGDDLEALREASRSLMPRLAAVAGVVDLESTAEAGNPELQISFERDQLAQLDLHLADVAAVVRGKVQGEIATRVIQGDREIDVRIRAVEPGEASVDDVADLIVAQRTVGGMRTISERTETGVLVEREVASGPGTSVPIRLGTLADVRLAEGPSEIRRIGQKRAALLAGGVEDRDMAAVAADVREILRSEPLPLGVTAVLGGQHEEMADSLRQMLLAMALAIFLVYLVMASQFESFLHPFVIIFSLPLAGVGVVLALAVTGRSLDVVAMIGAVMLAGIVVNNAIVLVDAVNRLRRDDGLSKTDALVEAGRRRLRPILMTTATTILGLTPMALGLGEGAELRAPLAITVIGGLGVATLLTLVVIPVVYSLLDRQRLAADLGVTPTDSVSTDGSPGDELEITPEPA